MYVMVLYILLSGIPLEYGIRSENGVDFDKFETLAKCEAQAKKDHAEIFENDASMVLKCEKR